MNWKFWQKAHTPSSPQKKKKEEPWWRSLLFAAVVATFIHWIFIQPFAIPTGSMENTLLVGDHLLVSKFHYGTRTTSTPLQIPLTHQTIWGTNIPSYSNLIELPVFRLPGFTEVKKNDIVVFNWPAELQYPISLRTFYVKRCLAVGGDTLAIKKRDVFINGQKIDAPEGVQYTYMLTTNSVVADKIFEKYGIPHNGENQKPLYKFSDSTSGYVIDLKPSVVKQLIEDHVVVSAAFMSEQIKDPTSHLFPKTTASRNWDIDNYGPVWIPKEGSSIHLNDSLVAIYASTIRDHEGWKSVEVKNGNLFIEGQKITEYTFRQNYYFMMGDNRNNSLDSRYWGFVPADHIVGKPILIWLSLDSDKSFFSKIRFRRMFSLID